MVVAPSGVVLTDSIFKFLKSYPKDIELDKV